MTSEHAYKRPAEYDDYMMDLSKAYYRKITRDVLQYCNGNSILDIGCYDGSLGEVVLKKGYKVYGVEAHHEASRRALEKGIEVVKRDIEEGLPWPDNTFDCVIAAEIIEHLYDTTRFIKEIGRVLKPGGVFVMSVPNIACLTNRLRLLLDLYPRYCDYRAENAAGHIRVYTMGSAVSQIKENSFDILRVAGANFPLPMHSRFIPIFVKKLAIFLGDYFPSLAGQIIISARNKKDLNNGKT
jgi:2-polyprenyl-3-methyl-5-hydroxy-6-metoxy-1,4-benzoquinol methylase